MKFLGAVGRASCARPIGTVDVLVSGFNETGFELLEQQPPSENFVFSPTSIFHTLLIARGAADDATASSITSGLSIPAGPDADAAWNVVNQQMGSWPRLSLANRVRPDVTTEPSQTWLDMLAAQHGTDVEALAFAEDPSGTRSTSGWQNRPRT